MTLDLICFIIAMILGMICCYHDYKLWKAKNKYIKELESEIEYLRGEYDYWKNRNYKKDDVINDIYQLIKKHYEE